MYFENIVYCFLLRLKNSSFSAVLLFMAIACNRDIFFFVIFERILIPGKGKKPAYGGNNPSGQIFIRGELKQDAPLLPRQAEYAAGCADLAPDGIAAEEIFVA
jgi:hypothetical protein